jgi:glutamate synthase domain-containing protein 2
MKTTGVQPDFITVDGAEGGTGAAPLEYSDSVGMPLEPALKFVCNCLTSRELRSEIRLIASGKVITAAQLIRMFSLGADLCNAARAFMLAVGCIQAQRCDTNKCPSGVATQNPSLTQGLVVDEKYLRVANFHKNTLRGVHDLMGSCGIDGDGNLMSVRCTTIIACKLQIRGLLVPGRGMSAVRRAKSFHPQPHSSL